MKNFYGKSLRSPYHCPFIERGSRYGILLNSPRGAEEKISPYKDSICMDSIVFFHLSNEFTIFGKPTTPLSELPATGIDIMVMPDSPVSPTVEEVLRNVVIEHGLDLSIQDSAIDSDTAAERMSFEHRGIEYDLWPSVVIPTYFCNWEYINFLRRLVAERRPRRILDIFSGSGVIGLSLARETQALVDFADVNFWGIRSTRSTGARNDIGIGDTMVSEGLRGIPQGKKYDLIVGNPPHHHGVSDTEKALPGFDPGFSIHQEFFEGVERILSDDGAVVFIEYAGSSVLSDVYQKLPPTLAVTAVRHQRNGMWYTVEVRRRGRG